MARPQGRTPSRARPLRTRTTEARERRPVVANNDPGSRITIPADDVIGHILGRCPSGSTRYSPGRLCAAYRSCACGAAEFLRRMLPTIAHRHATTILGIGIVRNHVHLVLDLPPLVDVPRLVQGLKGASARIANRDGVMPRAKLQWATGYDLRSVGVRDVRRAITYVRSQNQRHPDMALVSPGLRARAGMMVRP